MVPQEEAEHYRRLIGALKAAETGASSSLAGREVAAAEQQQDQAGS